MSETKLVAETRTEFGKGAARRIRRADQIPAVMYGHGTDPVHVTLPGHDTMLALKAANALLSIEHRRQDDQLALAKDVQRDVDQARSSSTSTWSSSAAARRSPSTSGSHVVGEAAADTVVTVETQTVELEVEATHIPEQVEVVDRGPRGRHPDPRRRPDPARGRDAGRRPRDPRRQHHRRR